MNAKTISVALVTLAALAAGCGDDAQTAPTVTVAIPSTTTASSTTAEPPPVGKPSGRPRRRQRTRA